MVKKPIVGFAVMAVILLQILGGVEAKAGKDIPPQGVKTPERLSRYEAQVREIREEYQAERERLGLDLVTQQTTTPDTPEVKIKDNDLGKQCRSFAGAELAMGPSAGGSPAGGGSPTSGSAGGSGGAVQKSACTASSKGAPVWAVNLVNMNFYMADSPLWYSSPVGPSVEIQLSYNSQSAITQHELFGSKWQFNYASYLVVDALGGVTAFMPDGRRDTYVAKSAGGYTLPYRVYNTLTKIAQNHYELQFPDGTVYVYNIPAGTASAQLFLVEIRDAHGQKLSLGYDVNVHLTQITDAQGKVTTLAYNASGLVTQVTGPFGRLAAFQYDTNRNLTKITDMGGYGTSFTYDPRVYLTSLTNAAGSWEFYFEPADGIYNGLNEYPAPGTPMSESYRITVTHPSGGKEEYYYDGFSGKGWHVSPQNYVTYVNPNTNNFANQVPHKVLEYQGTQGNRGEISSISASGGGTFFAFSYDTNGNLTSASNPGRHYTYNQMGQITSVTDAKGSVTTLAYAANGVDLTGFTNGLGTIAMTYDTSHDVTSVTDRLGNKTQSAYNSYGQPTSATDPLGIATNYAYDTSQLLAQITRDGQTLGSLTYDPMSRVKTFTDATGRTLTYDYNNIDDITKITYPDGRYLSIDYSSDIPHLIAGVTDAGGRDTDYTYDSSQQLIQIVDPEGGIAEFVRDLNGNIIQQIDPKGNTTSSKYDAYDRLIKRTYADGTFVSLKYEGAPFLVSSLTNARGIVSTYSYDSNNNLVKITYSDGPAKVELGYDQYQRLNYRGTEATVYQYVYDANSRLTSVTSFGMPSTDVVTLGYDAKGRRTSLALQGGQNLAYTYDTLDRLTKIRDGSNTYSYAYSGASPLIQKLTRPNGSFTEYQYDTLMRLTGVTNKTSSGGVINQYLYGYNNRDLRSSETVTNGTPITAFQNESVVYSYNNVNQLVKSTSPNRTFVYDADGNMTQGYTPEGYPWIAGYDAENRLYALQYTGAGGDVYTVLYGYDGYGLLGERREYVNNTVVNDTYYVRFGSLVLQERDANNNVTRKYEWGPSMGGGIGGLLNLNQEGQDYSYLYDGKGNVTALVDSAQSVAAGYAYDPFGTLMAKAGTLDQPFQFSTKPYEEKTGLSYYGYRFYAPAVGRWMTRDPIGERGGLNLYGFVSNDPANRIDPSGLTDWGALIQWYYGEKIPAKFTTEMIRDLKEIARVMEGKTFEEIKEIKPVIEKCWEGAKGWKPWNGLSGVFIIFIPPELLLPQQCEPGSGPWSQACWG